MRMNFIRRIVTYSDNNYDDIYSQLKRYYASVGIDNEMDLLNVSQITRSSLEKKGYQLIEMPIEDRGISSLNYKKDGKGYVVINTSLPKSDIHFNMAHEIYHVYYGKEAYTSRLELSDEPIDQEDEYAAYLFAGMLLMPEPSFRRMYIKFRNDSNGLEIDTIVRLMNYYEAPYHAVLIRCLQFHLIERNDLNEELLNVDEALIRNKLSDLWLDCEVLTPTNRDEYKRIATFVKRLGEKYTEEGTVTDRTVKKVLKNMDDLYDDLKGG